MFKHSRIFQITLNTFVFLSLVLGSALTVTPVYAAIITVNTSADSLVNDGTCSLREALTNANGDSQLYATVGECATGIGIDTITFAANYTITLSAPLPAVTTTIIINGNGETNTIIQANATPDTATYRVFEVTSIGNLTLNSLTIRNGRCNGSCASSTNTGGGVYNAGALIANNVTFSGNAATNGGGMYNINNSPILTNVTFSGNAATTGSGGGMFNYTSNPTLTNVTFSSNSATYGGGMGNDGSSPTLTNVTFSSNSASDVGGGMVNYTSNPTLTNVTFSSNSALNYGGGMYNYTSNPTLTNVTFSSNSAYSGGGMYNSISSPTLTNVTFSSNSASYGGGMSNYASSSPILTNVTFSGNSATIGGGGMFNFNSSSPTLKNVIIANSTGGDCINSSSMLNAASSNNLIEDSANACGLTNGVSSNIIGSDPNLGALTGSPAYFPLNSGSPAIDAGNDTICAAAPVSNTSQNGVTRPQSIHCDIGSFEKSLTFLDVPYNYWANTSIERLYTAGITGGCSASPLNYCPENLVTRDQMAVFLERGIHGSSFFPPNVIPTFNDTAGNFAEDWIEALKNDGITSGCGTNIYCPNQGVTRAQMAIFLERAMHGASFTPPNVTPTFTDTVGNFAEDWIEALKNDGITSGCGPNIYCPDAVVTRAQMAVFLVAAFGLP